MKKIFNTKLHDKRAIETIEIVLACVAIVVVAYIAYLALGEKLVATIQTVTSAI